MTTRSPTPEPTAPNPAAYAGRRIAVGTRHGKQDQLGPAFREVLGADLVVPPDLDTDRFGTFSGEIPRTMPAADAARAKARLAMSITGLPFGMASEASYGPLPGLGWPGHEEILLFCDDEHGFEILEGHRTTEVPGTLRTVAGIDDVPPPLLAGLPDQALIVRPGGDPGPVEAITKGITDPEALRRAIDRVMADFPDRLAVVEPDLRAQHNPSRRRVLSGLARTLARRLATRCPRCRLPGFGRVDVEPGLPCRACGTPTALAGAEIHGCGGCGHRITRPVAAAYADPADCPACNP